MVTLFDLASNIANGHLRLGIAQGGYIAYVEVAASGVGFKFSVCRDDVPLCEGEAPDFMNAKTKAEAVLKFLCNSSKHPSLLS